MIEIEQLGTYIIKGIKAGNDTDILKVRIIEKTETSLFIENTDKKCRFRQSINEFNNTYKVIEIIETNEQMRNRLINHLRAM